MLRSILRWAHERELPTLAACSAGLVASLLAYGVLQERVMTQPYCYGSDCEYFTNSIFLVFANRSIGSIVILLAILARGEDPFPCAPLREFVFISLGNVFATTCQYEALKYVSFPVATLAKCAKMLPVVTWGTFAHGKSYPPRDYAAALSIFIGCALFLLSGDFHSRLVPDHSVASATRNPLAPSSPPSSATAAAASNLSSRFSSAVASGKLQDLYGVCLLLAYLGLDGFTSTAQDATFKNHQPTSLNMILYTTLCSIATTSIGLCASGESLVHSIRVLKNHSVAVAHVVLLSLTACLGQIFIAQTVRIFGALLFATVMTLRQFASILMSCAIFKHPLSRGQWLGTTIVFGALHLKTLAKKPELDGGNESGGYNSTSVSSKCASASTGEDSHVTCARSRSSRGDLENGERDRVIKASNDNANGNAAM